MRYCAVSMGKIRIGARTNVQDNATVRMTHEVSDAVVGSDVIVGHNAVIHGAIIEDEVLIGMVLRGHGQRAGRSGRLGGGWHVGSAAHDHPAWVVVHRLA